MTLLLLGCNGTDTVDQLGKDTFIVCNDKLIAEYWFTYDKDPTYIGEKKAIKQYFLQNFKEKESFSNENGYVTIGFIVNCKGQSGNFTVEEMGTNYQPYEFNPEITQQILKLTKQLDKWTVGISEGTELNHHRYLTFKIAQGKITDILP